MSDTNVTITENNPIDVRFEEDTISVDLEDGLNVSLGNVFLPTHGTSHLEGEDDAIDVEKLNIAGDFDLETYDLVSGATTVWDNTADEIPDSALGSIDNSTLTNSTITLNANDGLVGGGVTALGGSVDLDIEPEDFAGLFLSDDGTDNLTVDIGRGLEDDGTGAIQFDEDTGYTFTVAQEFSSGITVTGTVSLDADAIDATEVDIARGLEDDGTGAIQFDEDVAYTFTADQSLIDDVSNLYGSQGDFSISYNSTSDELEIVDEINNTVKASFDKAGDVYIPNGALQIGGDLTDGTNTIWDSVNAYVPQGRLENDSVTLATGNGLKNGGTVALGSSTTFDVEPADFAGGYLSDDGNDNLQVNLGDGIEGDGAGNIRVDEDFSFTFTGAQTFNGGITMGSNIDFQSTYSATNVPDPEAPDELSNKSYVDGVAQGLNLKESARASPTVNIDLTSTTDPNPVDGVTLVDGNRVLLKNQTDGTENGLYVATTATDPSTWVRAPDFNEDTEVTSGSFAFIEEGTENGNTSYIITTNDPITLGTTAIVWSQFASAGEITAGDGLSKSGLTLSVTSSDLAGAYLSADGSNNLQANIGRGLESDGSDNIQFDEDTAYTFTAQQSFNAGLDTQGDIANGTVTIWDASVGEIPDNAMGSIDNSTLTNSSVTVAGNSVSLGGSTAVSTGDLSGDTDGLTEGTTNLFYTDERAQDGVGNILGGNFTYDDAGNTITLTSDTVTVAGNNVSLGGSTAVAHSDLSTISVDDHHNQIQFSNGGTAVLTQPTDVNAGTNVSISDDGDGTITLSSTDTGVTDHGNLTGLGDDDHTQYLLADGTRSMSGSLTLGGDLLATNGEVIWDESATEIPDSAMGSIDNSTLTNDTIAVTPGTALTGGGNVSLGGSFSLSVVPSDIAGSYLSEDANTNLQVDIGTGLTGDGSGNIEVDESYPFAFSSAILTNGIGLSDDITDGGTVVYDESAGHIPSSIVETAGLDADSVDGYDVAKNGLDTTGVINFKT